MKWMIRTTIFFLFFFQTIPMLSAEASDFADAIVVTPDSTYTDSLAVAGEMDKFKFTSAIEGEITVELQSPADKNYDFEIYKMASWSNYVAGSYNPMNEMDTASFQLEADVDYYIVIYGSSGQDFSSDLYALTLSAVLQDTSEPNEFELATAVSPGTTHISALSITGDVNMYSFTTPTEASITINLSSPQGKNYDMEVYLNANWANYLLGSYEGIGMTDSLTFLVQPGIDYYIIVYGESADDFGEEPYELVLSSLVQDTYEPNNSFEDAVDLLVNSPLQSYVFSYGDLDIYTFMSDAAGGMATIELESPEGKNYDFEIYTAADWANYVTGSYNGVDQLDVAVTLLQPDTAYYIVIYGADEADFGPNPYTLTLSIEAIDSSEPNDTFEQATPAIPGKKYEATIAQSGDIDIFKFTSVLTGQLTVKLKSPSGNNYDFEIYKDGDWANYVTGSYNAQADSAIIEVDPNSTYYVLVYGENAEEFSEESYELSLGNLAHYVYDATNRIKKVQLADGSELNYTYDANGNLISRTLVP